MILSDVSRKAGSDLVKSGRPKTLKRCSPWKALMESSTQMVLDLIISRAREDQRLQQSQGDISPGRWSTLLHGSFPPSSRIRLTMCVLIAETAAACLERSVGSVWQSAKQDLSSVFTCRRKGRELQLRYVKSDNDPSLLARSVSSTAVRRLMASSMGSWLNLELESTALSPSLLLKYRSHWIVQARRVKEGRKADLVTFENGDELTRSLGPLIRKRPRSSSF